MIVVCPSCSSRFQYGDERFQGAKFKRFQCPKCRTVFEVKNPALPEAPAVPPPPAPTPTPQALQPVPPARPQRMAPEPASGPTETTSRNRNSLMSAAGLHKSGLPGGTRFSLAFLTGPHASTVRLLTKPVTLIGREEGDIVTQDPETSRQHARIEIREDGTVWLSDLGSTNGTFIGAQALEKPTELSDQQEFTCGKSTFMMLIRSLDPSHLD